MTLMPIEESSTEEEHLLEGRENHHTEDKKDEQPTNHNQADVSTPPPITQPQRISDDTIQIGQFRVKSVWLQWTVSLLSIGVMFLCALSLLVFVQMDEREQTATAVAVAIGEALQQPAVMTPTLPIPTARPTAVPPPFTCTDLQKRDPTAADGDYTLFYNHNTDHPIEVYCHNMDSTPIEYISLGEASNQRNYAASTYPGDELITQFAKLRLNIHTLVVDITDRTFATTSGSVPAYSPITQNDYGTARGCNEGQPGTVLGRANIDLTETSFALDDTVSFRIDGADIEGEGAVIGDNGKVVNMTIGGRCGWIVPVGELRLRYAP